MTNARPPKRVTRTKGSASAPTESTRPFSVDDYAWLDASTLIEESDKREVLHWFVHQVRAGKSINSEVLRFIADGIDAFLSGKKPWAGKLGVKKPSVEEALRKAVPLWCAYESFMMQAFERGKPTISAQGKAAHVLPYGPREARTFAADKMGISEDTVKRAIELVQRERLTTLGAPLVQALETVHRFELFLETPDGKRWLKSAEGRAWLKSARGKD